MTHPFAATGRPVGAATLLSGTGSTAERSAAPAPPVVRGAADDADVARLSDLLDQGHAVLCCGYWRDSVAARLQQRVAKELGVPLRRLGDVHLSNSSARITSSAGDAGVWGAVAVLYLDAPGGSEAVLELPPEGGMPRSAQMVEATTRNLVVVPSGGQLIHSTPHRVAWMHLRMDGKPGRSRFDYYFVAWVRANFVAPYDTDSQRRLFSGMTRYPRYWHGFMWSFIGMFFTVFACLPLAWRGIQHMERLYLLEAGGRPRDYTGAAEKLPTLLSHGGRPSRLEPPRKWSGSPRRQAALSPEPLV